jgi:competence protein ComEC
VSNKIIYTLIGGLATGIALSSFVLVGIFGALALILVGAIIFFYLTVVENMGWRANLALFLVPLFLISAGFGFWRMTFQVDGVQNPKLDRLVGEKVTLTGIVSDELDVREKSSQVTLSIYDQSSPTSKGDFLSKVLARTDNFNNLDYGDEVEVSGKLEKAKNFSSETGRTFNYEKFLAKDGIGYIINFARFKKVDSNKGNFVVAKLLAFKHAFTANLAQLISEPQASLLGGLIVGAKEALGKNLLDDFRKVGVIHIVVLSGYNITIVAESLMSFFKVFLPNVFATSFGVLSIIAFALMTGASATVVRASIMALLVIVAKIGARRYDITRALLLAGLVMLINNPAILVFDPSFQLSFLATVGLIFVSPIVERWLQFVPEKFKMREVAVATLATQIFVLPYILYQMGTFSVVALPVNLLILSAIPLTMLLGFLAGIFGFVSLLLATPFAFGAYIFLAYELGVVNWFAKLPFASFSVPAFPFWLVILVYVGYFFLYQRLKVK